MESHMAYISYNGTPGFDEAKRCWKSTELEGGSIGDGFRVDDLLDFSNEEIAGPVGEDRNSEESLRLSNQSAHSSLTIADKLNEDVASNSAPIPNNLHQDDISTGLCVRCDDIAELEWLSTFVEDSFSVATEFKTGFFSGGLNNASPVNYTELSSQKGELQTGFHSGGPSDPSPESCTDLSRKEDEFHNASPLSGLESSASVTSESLSSHSQDMSLPGRARSKRSRSGVRIWSSRILTSTSSSSSDSISTNWQPPEAAAASCFFISCDGPALSAETEFISTAELCGAKSFPAVKLCKRKAWQDRRCTHCLTQKTPQWRAGPRGPKTLCNACGVRFKSGRLFPEYRPAGSPTFLPHKHSNSHRKVLEMRHHTQISEQQK
ncbi:hypothetical protein O6H91_05G003000 [Diphasiastrum complanatum]|uniref:Uncharacterized protein n=3 Tax=Diphasiastrum complanatum TaxID=34168 RepID=A0ACC2DK28_DIPCM|nr:hypothetical protein O6H91_05G003000 [Diphasiastrum complanatum]KAJ7554666.1 hypothetical protein O6H91_05G003000 [Diphasiastrum complanatum]KAJ7554667.1 hypothetical protein O6H91_05G003000 [Diphasiastrum complanatum]